MKTRLLLILLYFCGISEAFKVTVGFSQNNVACQSVDQLKQMLIEMSKLWNNVTGRVIEDFHIELPSHFAWECLSDSIKAVTTIEEPDIKVVPSEWTEKITSLQFGNCGQKGHGVLLPMSALMEKQVEMNQLLRHWMNHRFGIYVESLDELNQAKNHSKLQHLLCQGKSASQVISELTKHDISRPYSMPNFTFLKKPAKKTYVLLVQKSFPEVGKKQSQQISWDIVQSALLPFISSLAQDDQLAIITYDQKTAEINLPLTSLTDDNRVILHSTLPRRPVINQRLSMNACHQCGLELLKTLQIRSDHELNVIWMVKSGQYPNSADFSTTTQKTVILAMDRNLDQSWSKSAAPVFALGQCSNASHCQRNLVNHLMQISQNHELRHTLVAQGQATGTLELDHDLSEINSVVTTTNERDIAWLKLVSPSGIPHVFPLYSHKMALLHLSQEHMEAGIWTFSVKMYDPLVSFHFDFYTLPTLKKAKFEAWIDTQISPLGHPKIKIFAATSQASNLPGKVEAIISRPGHLDQDLPLVKIPLKDNGKIYPDLRSQDGIFSAFFIDVSPEAGFYQVSIIAYDNDQSVMSRTLSPSFHVPQMSSSFYIRQETGSKLLVSDVFPPNRITDLTLIVNNSQESKEELLFATMEWTAPGADFDLENSTAFRYEVRCATSEESLLENNYGEQSITIHSSLVPIPMLAGTKQRCSVGVPWHDQRFFYAILAIDSAGNRGLISNVISVLVAKPESAESSSDTPLTSTLWPLSPQPQITDLQSSLVVWLPILSLLFILIGSVIFGAFYARRCRLQEYVCDNDSIHAASESDKETETNTTSVSSIVSSNDFSDSSSSQFETWPQQQTLVEPRVHIMEDFSVYRDLSIISSEVPSEYLKIDMMLSALLAAKQQQKLNESLV